MIFALTLSILNSYAQTNFNFQWAKSIGGYSLTIGKSEGYAIKEDANDNTYVAATFSNTMDFDPTNNTNYITASGYDLFLSKYDSNGHFLWAKTFTLSTSSSIMPQEIEIGSSGDVYMFGVFSGTFDFDPSNGTALKTEQGNGDIFLSKFDSNGNLIWVNTFGSTNQDRGVSIILDNSDNLYTTGFYAGTIDFDPSASVQNLTSVSSNPDIFIAKYTASGGYIWAKSIGGSSNDQPKKIVLDYNNDILVSGDFQSTIVDFDPSMSTSNLNLIGVIDAFFAKYDINGNYIFAKNIGSSSMVTANSIISDTQNNIYINGYFTSTCDFDPSAATNTLSAFGGQDSYIAKYNSAGDFNWVKQIGGTGNDVASEIEIDNNNDIYIAGRFTGTCDFDPSSNVANCISSGSSDLFIAKYDSNGNYSFVRNFGSTVTGTPYISELDVKPSGKINIVGSFYGNIDFDPSPSATNVLSSLTTSLTPAYFMAKYDLNGNHISAFTGTQKKGGTDETNSIVTDASGNLYVTGYFTGTVDFDPSTIQNCLVSNGLEDIFIAKYDPNGNYLWAKNIGNTNNDRANSIKIDNSGNIFITGYISTLADFDPSAATYTISSGAYYAKYDNSGNFLLAGSIPNAFGNSIAIDLSGNIYITGYYTGTSDFDPSSGVFNLTSMGNEDVFIAKYNNTGALAWAISLGGINPDIANDIFVSPSGGVYITGQFQGTADFNPSTTTFNITSNGATDIFYAQYNNSGGFIFAKAIGGTGNDIGYSITIDNSSRVLVAGQFSGTADFDPDAATYNVISKGAADAFVARFDSFGSFGMFGLVGQFGGTSTDVCKDMYVDANGNIFITGNFMGVADFDPTSTVSNIISNGSNDIFIAMLTTPISLVWAKSIGGTGTEFSNTLSVLNYNDIYIGGTHLGTTDFDPSTNTYSITSAQSTTDLYIAKYNQCTYPQSSAISVYNNNPICAGLTATLTVGSSQLNSATQWQWYSGSCGGTPIATGATLNIVPTTTTTYFVRGEGGCISTPSLCASRTISVTTSPTVNINGVTSPICSGTTMTLTSSGATSYTWNTGATTNSIVVSPTISTTYSIIGTTGACSDSDIQSISVNPIPTLTITGINSLCSGQSSTLSVNGANSYTWNTSSNSSSISITPSVTTSYTVNGQDANGCVNSSIKTVTVNNLPVVNIVGSNTVCLGNNIILTGNGANTYTWSTNSNLNSISVTPITNTTYSLSGTNLAGCTSSNVSITTITVIPLPVISINTSTTTICSGTNVNLTASGANTYTWSNSSNSNPINVIPMSSTIYSVNGTNANGCQNSSPATVSITVNQLPNIITSTSNSIICVGQTATLTANGANTYTWSTGNNSSTVTVSPTVTTNYSVSAIDGNGCQNTSTLTQTVSTCTGTNEILTSNAVFSIYPNPTDGIIVIKQNTLFYDVYIYNSLGVLVKKLYTHNELNEIDLNDLSAGIYFIKIGNHTNKILKK